jgi:hypothetical protein
VCTTSLGVDLDKSVVTTIIHPYMRINIYRAIKTHIKNCFIKPNCVTKTKWFKHKHVLGYKKLKVEVVFSVTSVTPSTTTTIGWEALPRYKTIIKQRQ